MIFNKSGTLERRPEPSGGHDSTEHPCMAVRSKPESLNVYVYYVLYVYAFASSSSLAFCSESALSFASVSPLFSVQHQLWPLPPFPPPCLAFYLVSALLVFMPQPPLWPLRASDSSLICTSASSFIFCSASTLVFASASSFALPQFPPLLSVQRQL